MSGQLQSESNSKQHVLKCIQVRTAARLLVSQPVAVCEELFGTQTVFGAIVYAVRVRHNIT